MKYQVGLYFTTLLQVSDPVRKKILPSLLPPGRRTHRIRRYNRLVCPQ